MTISGQRTDVLRRLWRIMELNADIDRNQSDATFAHNGGIIHYIFDENIFEMFARPFARANYVSAFYSRSRTPVPISSQSALICSEYLLSGHPGQQGKQIYMTEWHFWELRDQVEHRRQELAAELDGPPGLGAIDEFLEKIEAIAHLQHADAAGLLDRLLRETDAPAVQDVSELRRRQIPEEVIRRFVVAREAARFMAADEVVEPLQQLDRIFSAEIAPRLRPLHMDFRPSNAIREKLAEDTRNWLRLLLNEQKIHSEHSSSELREERPRASFHNDARSLAYILWIVRACARPNERFVLVTGDRLLFDAYRRWHVKQPPGEPFVLRRILQFAPFINFNDIPNDVTDARSLFVQTRQAVEVPLIAFNLAQSQESVDPDSAPAPHAARAREHLLLLLSRPGSLDEEPAIKYFAQRIDDAWLSTRASEVSALRSAWRRFERMTIGANYQLVARRLDRAQRQRAEMAAGRGAVGARDAFVSYLRQLLERIVRNSIKLWFPLAAEFIQSSDWPGNPLGSQARVPIALRLNVPVPAGGGAEARPVERREVDALLDDWRKGDQEAARILDVAQNTALSESQHLVFAIAATLALRLALWSQAGRYADLASSAADISSETAEVADIARQDAAECLYLKALATRFRLGSFAPHRSAVTDNVWRRWLASAVSILDKCEAYHQAPAPGEHHLLRELRAISERAALRLFYSAWAASTPQMPPLAFFPAKEGFVELQAAMADLRRCLELEPAARASSASDGQRTAFFSRLERQLVTNCAAAEVIAYLFERNFDFGSAKPLVDEDGWVMRRIREWAIGDQGQSLPTVVRVDLSAFLVLRRGDREGSRYLRKLDADKSRWPPLAIDQAVLRAILVQLPSD